MTLSCVPCCGSARKSKQSSRRRRMPDRTLAQEMAALCADLYEAAGTHIAAPCPGLQVATRALNSTGFPPGATWIWLRL